ncbi:hypothetical protein J7I94_09175 [Streptomyces sp. ISL-12]|uniref:hypothetical protein n=1 Tax=Streptomyces sp. ISL-12 TaxID=2819177 RepID=UPI001BE79187|nr:hypothetical protein [Streptomyces sp. ISL-12]MBT2410729.1 hypothetical protein [Streptomyces sp. ISL-12]
MPRPTVAQFAYGSLTVILSTFAMLLLSQTTSAGWIAVVAVVALTLGLLVAMTVPTPKPRTVAVHRPAATTGAAADAAPVPVASRAAGEAVGQRAA